MDYQLTPQSLDSFIGQPLIIENLKIYIQAALGQQRMMDHLLFMGPSGLGKTTLSQIIANEFNVSLKIINAATIENTAQLAHIFSNINAGDIVLLDEIHALNGKCEEFLYPILQDYRLDFIIQYANQSKVINLHLPPFTLIGATTKPYQISTPLLNRFPIQFTFQPYELNDIESIIRHNGKQLGLNFDDVACTMLAYVSRLTPRLINAHLKRLLDYQYVYQNEMIDVTFLNRYIAKQGITAKGLTKTDVHYLNYLANERTSKGLASIALSLNMDPSIIVDQIEPYLLRIGYIELTKSGRKLTQLALKDKDEWEIFV